MPRHEPATSHEDDVGAEAEGEPESEDCQAAEDNSQTDKYSYRTEVRRRHRVKTEKLSLLLHHTCSKCMIGSGLEVI